MLVFITIACVVMGMFPFLFNVFLLLVGTMLALLAFMVLFQAPLVWVLNKLFGNEDKEEDRDGPSF